MTLLSDTAYPSFIGEVEALDTTTIRRLIPSARHQLPAIALVDHGWAQSIYFKDPNGLSLEYCCMVRNLTEDDAMMQERFTIPRGALDLNNTLSAKVPAA